MSIPSAGSASSRSGFLPSSFESSSSLGDVTPPGAPHQGIRRLFEGALPDGASSPRRLRLSASTVPVPSLPLPLPLPLPLVTPDEQGFVCSSARDSAAAAASATHFLNARRVCPPAPRKSLAPHLLAEYRNSSFMQQFDAVNKRISPLVSGGQLSGVLPGIGVTLSNGKEIVLSQYLGCGDNNHVFLINDSSGQPQKVFRFPRVVEPSGSSPAGEVSHPEKLVERVRCASKFYHQQMRSELASYTAVNDTFFERGDMVGKERHELISEAGLCPWSIAQYVPFALPVYDATKPVVLRLYAQLKDIVQIAKRCRISLDIQRDNFRVTDAEKVLIVDPLDCDEDDGFSICKPEQFGMTREQWDAFISSKD